MKKILLLSLLACASLVAQEEPRTQTISRDSIFTNLYYNTDRFTNGLFDEVRTPLISAESYPYTQFFWDLNDVIFTVSVDLYQALQHPLVGLMLGRLYLQKLYYKQYNDPRGYVWDALISSLETTDSGRETATLARQMTQGFNTLNPAMISLLQELEANGHSNTVLSNMGIRILQLHITKLENRLISDELSQEERERIMFTLRFLTKPTNFVSSEDNSWMHKPDRESYQTCLSNNPAINPYGLKIFIDDKRTNIEAAIAHGFDIAIQFKNAQDLRTILNTLSICQQ